jgi:flagellar motor switch protein FliG
MDERGAVVTSPGTGKAALLLVALGAEAASEVMRHLDEDDRAKVVEALSRVRAVETEEIDRIGREFAASLEGVTGMPLNGRDFARMVVTRALGEAEAGAYEPLRAALSADAELDDLGRVLESVPGAGLADLLAREHPQVAAVILAHLDPAPAAEAVAALPVELRGELLERVARLERIPEELRADLGATLKDELRDAVRPEGSAVGGPRAVAEILNCADAELEEALLARIGEMDADLAETIRTLMFTFEDCAKLDDRSLQALLKDVARDDLLLAMKTATPGLLEKIFANVSSRAAEILREDLSSMGGVRLADVEAAQARIIAVLRQLEADGKVVIAAKAKGDVLV